MIQIQIIIAHNNNNKGIWKQLNIQQHKLGNIIDGFEY
jgi:hypothetical protein